MITVKDFTIQGIGTGISSVQLSANANGGIIVDLTATWVGRKRQDSPNEMYYYPWNIYMLASDGAAGRYILGNAGFFGIPAYGYFNWDNPYGRDIIINEEVVAKLAPPAGSTSDFIPGFFKTSAYIHALLEASPPVPGTEHDLRIQARLLEFET